MQAQLHSVWPHTTQSGLLMALVERDPKVAQVIPLRPAVAPPRSVSVSESAPETVSEVSDSTEASVYSDSTQVGLSQRSNNQPVDTIIEELLRDHLPTMFRLAKSIVRDTALAEDVVQESLLKAWQASQTFRGDSSLRSWALRITHNTAISTLRRRREDYREPARLPEAADPMGLTDRQVHGRMMVDQLWVALEQLEPVSRSIVVLREVDCLSYEEIAETLELPLPTVKTRLFRARKLLAVALEDWR
jgi:RNA polymerase sigma-70 factor, ECF subfamily